MSGNSFGTLYCVTSFGESHGPAYGGVVDGCPPGLALSANDIQKELDRRKPGSSRHVTQRRESDTVEILSGVYEGRTTGTAIGFLVRNEDPRPKDYSAIAEKFLPRLAARLERAGVELRGCARTCAIVLGAKSATEADWEAEYKDLVLAIKVVDSLDEAIAFIAQHGSKLADAIVTGDREAAARFEREVDSACVYVNASTRFTDGFEFGFGAETGISTNRLHARGPMGLRELTTYKYLVHGAGQVRN